MLIKRAYRITETLLQYGKASYIEIKLAATNHMQLQWDKASYSALQQARYIEFTVAYEVICTVHVAQYAIWSIKHIAKMR